MRAKKEETARPGTPQETTQVTCVIYKGRTSLAFVGVIMLCVVLGMGLRSSSAMASPCKGHFEVAPESFGMAPSTIVGPGSEREPSYAPNNQAGAHADWLFKWDFVHNSNGETCNDLRELVLDVPAGFMGNADRFAFPQCTIQQLASHGSQPPECSPASQVGTITLDLDLFKQAERVTFPLYNMAVTSFGVTAEVGFKAVGFNTYTIQIGVRPGDQGIESVSLSPELGEPHEIAVTIWGLPAAHEHDSLRGLECYSFTGETIKCEKGGEEAKSPVVPFLANPTNCAGPLMAALRADSWEHPEEWSEAQAAAGPMVGCERIHFNPGFMVTPTTDAVESSSGLNVTLEVPQTWDNPETLATSTTRAVKVTLPGGYTINPSEGNGLAGCSPAQYAAETSFSERQCPSASKLGTVVIETPLLAGKIEGSVYLAQPYENIPAFGDEQHPGGSLLALYVVAKDPARGIIIKTAGEVQPDPVTGQLVSTFEDLPQQPFSRVILKFTQAAASPLVSPPACGSYTAVSELTPYSAPDEPRRVLSTLQIEKGIGEGPCPAGGIPPFGPTVISGTQNNAAGTYSPFYLRILRSDGEQEITRFTTTLPPGLTANLNGIPFCSDGQIEAARQASGQREIDAPTCPAASEVGHTMVGAGVGSVLAWTPGKVYLAGAYHGSSLSIVSVTSAVVGPFDLGTVVIRFALRINSLTGQAEIDSAGSDPIPHIINGIVVHVRDIHVYIDRRGFMLNPTGCKHKTIVSTITGAGADPSNPSDQDQVTIATPFQAANCASLAFRPVFTAQTSSKTSRASGASLHVKLVYPRAPQSTQSNIRSVKVDLPKQLPSRLSTLQKACADSTFDANPAACPAASRVGVAKAITPILPVPLEGPAYFVSHGGAKFPELVIVLQGYGITIDLHGETFISKRGITSSTFRSVPDQPVKIFELTLPQGADSALAAGGNLCKTRLKMPTAFTAQNGAVIHQSTSIFVAGCRRHKTPRHASHSKKGKKK